MPETLAAEAHRDHRVAAGTEVDAGRQARCVAQARRNRIAVRVDELPDDRAGLAAALTAERVAAIARVYVAAELRRAVALYCPQARLIDGSHEVVGGGSQAAGIDQIRIAWNGDGQQNGGHGHGHQQFDQTQAGLLLSLMARAATRPHGCSLHRSCPSARSEEHTSELQSLMRISYAVFCLKKKKQNKSVTETASY